MRKNKLIEIGDAVLLCGKRQTVVLICDIVPVSHGRTQYELMLPNNRIIHHDYYEFTLLDGTKLWK